MRLGPFYFEGKELFLIIAVVFLGLSIVFEWPLYFFDKTALFTICIVILITKGLLSSVHNEAFFFHSFVAIILSRFIPVFQLILFYYFTFFVLKLLKVL